MFYFQNNPEKLGAFLAMSSGLLYALLGYFGMSLMASGFSLYTMAFWRFCSATIFIAFLAANKKCWRNVKPRQAFRDFLVGSVFYSLPGFLFFAACKMIGTGQAMVIFFIYPAFVMVLNAIFNKVPIRPAYLVSFGVILSGLLMLVDLKELSFDIAGIGLSVFSAFCYAVYLFLSDKSEVAALPSTFLISLGCALTALALSLMDHSFMLPTAPVQWLNILGIGIICTAIPILLLLRAMDFISSDKASLFSVLEPVFTVIFGVILLGEILSTGNIFGILLILGGALSIELKR